MKTISNITALFAVSTIFTLFAGSCATNAGYAYLEQVKKVFMPEQ